MINLELHIEGLAVINEFPYPSNRNNFKKTEPGFYKTLLWSTNFASPLVKLTFHCTTVQI